MNTAIPSNCMSGGTTVASCLGPLHQEAKVGTAGKCLYPAGRTSKLSYLFSGADPCSRSTLLQPPCRDTTTRYYGVLPPTGCQCRAKAVTTARHAPLRSTTIFATSLIACENGTDSLLLSLTLVKLPRNNVCSLLSWASLCLVHSEHISHRPQGARALAIRAALFGISIAIHLATAMLDSLVVSRNQSPRRFLAISSGLACLPPHSVQPYSIDIVNRGDHANSCLCYCCCCLSRGSSSGNNLHASSLHCFCCSYKLAKLNRCLALASIPIMLPHWSKANAPT